MTNPASKRLDTLGVVRTAIVALMFIAGAALYSYLPDMIPTHWGFEGQPNQWSPKTWGVWLIPLMSLAFLVFFPILPKLDPRRENYEKFKQPWGVIQTSLIAFMAYIFGVTMFVTFYAQYNAMVGRAVVFGMGVLFVILGNYMGKIRQNYFVGLKTPWTLDDPEVWQKSQRLTGWAFVLFGLLAIIESILWIAVPYMFFAGLAMTILVPLVYSYKLAAKKKRLKA